MVHLFRDKSSWQTSAEKKEQVNTGILSVVYSKDKKQWSNDNWPGLFLHLFEGMTAGNNPDQGYQSI